MTGGGGLRCCVPSAELPFCAKGHVCAPLLCTTSPKCRRSCMWGSGRGVDVGNFPWLGCPNESYIALFAKAISKESNITPSDLRDHEKRKDVSATYYLQGHSQKKRFLTLLKSQCLLRKCHVCLKTVLPFPFSFACFPDGIFVAGGHIYIYIRFGGHHY